MSGDKGKGHSHGHSHGHHHHHGHGGHGGHGGHDHDHDHGTGQSEGVEFSLYEYVDTSRGSCLNEAQPGMWRHVFKPHDKRLETSKFLESDADEQLILYVPFTGGVKVKSICIIGDAADGKAPNKLKVWTNRDDIDFDNADELKPTQEWDLQPDGNPGGSIEYGTMYARFQTVSSLTLYFPGNFGAETTKVFYVGLKGEYTATKRQAVAATYEARPMASDHKGQADVAPRSGVS